MPGYLRIDDAMTAQEQRQQRYRERYKTLRPGWDDSVMALSRLFRGHVPAGAVVLDAGCGRSNYVLEQNRPRVGRVVGFDVTREATTGNTVADEILLGDLEALPFAPETFDAVVSLWVLEHVHHPQAVFSEVARVLKPGGRFFFVTPYSYSYILLAKRLAGARATGLALKRLYGRTEDDTFDTDYRANTPRDIRRLADEAGLKELTLVANEDPSYLGLNDLLFSVAVGVQDVMRALKLPFADMHLIGVYEKPRVTN